MMRAIGLMSGTSLDGIDVADVEVERAGGHIAVRLLHFATVGFGPLRAAIDDMLPPSAGSAAGISELGFALGEAFATAVISRANAWGTDLKHIDVIGSHGQTVYHAPDDGHTLQIGESSVIAARTGVTCVADFRPADVAAGGQGAPLVPFVDRALFADVREYRVALNLGGIANVTWLPPRCEPDDVRAFDTGPGMMAIDACVRLASGDASAIDEAGRRAEAGTVHSAMLDELLADPYFARRGPKSTGRERFGAAYAKRFWDRARERGVGADDAIATITALTAATIAANVPPQCDRIIASGGGAHNAALVRMLGERLSTAGRRTVVDRSDAHGIPVDAKEAIAFAVLAVEAIHGSPASMPACTGARSAQVLGKIAPGANYARLMRAVWTAGSTS